MGSVRDLLADLDRAIRRPDGQLLLEYQPIVDVAPGSVAALEVLVRWDHPRLGRLQPADFLPLLDASPLSQPFTDLVIDRATRLLCAVQAFAPAVGLAINVSARNRWCPP